MILWASKNHAQDHLFRGPYYVQISTFPGPYCVQISIKGISCWDPFCKQLFYRLEVWGELRRRDRLLAAISCVALLMLLPLGTGCIQQSLAGHSCLHCDHFGSRLCKICFSLLSRNLKQITCTLAVQKFVLLNTSGIKPSGGRLVLTYLSVGMKHCT